MNRPANVNIRSDQISQLVDELRNQPHDRLDDSKLFHDLHQKCRCCFEDLSQVSAQNIIQSWHREDFLAMTGVELSSESDNSSFLCLNCIELVKMSKIFIDLKGAADRMKNLQNRYNEFSQKLVEPTRMKEENESVMTIREFSIVEPKVEQDDSEDSNDKTLICDDDEFDDEQAEMNATLLPEHFEMPADDEVETESIQNIVPFPVDNNHDAEMNNPVSEPAAFSNEPINDISTSSNVVTSSSAAEPKPQSHVSLFHPLIIAFFLQ